VFEMEQTVTMKVDDITDSISKTGKTFWMVVGEGKSVYVWEKEIIEQIQEGATYRFGIKGDKFQKVVKIEKIADACIEDSKTMEKYRPAEWAGEKGTNKRCAMITAKDIITQFASVKDGMTSDDIATETCRIAEKLLHWLESD